jgi:hypothetical protein
MSRGTEDADHVASQAPPTLSPAPPLMLMLAPPPPPTAAAVAMERCLRLSNAETQVRG